MPRIVPGKQKVHSKVLCEVCQVRTLPSATTHLIKPSGSSVQAVGPVVNGQLILPSVDCERSFGNAVGHPANHCSEVGLLLEVPCKAMGGQSMSILLLHMAHTYTLKYSLFT